jgi:Na+/H+-dicarboxylate symporter
MRFIACVTRAMKFISAFVSSIAKAGGTRNVTRVTNVAIVYVEYWSYFAVWHLLPQSHLISFTPLTPYIESYNLS